ncbi:MAG: histidine phosphatase family protein [Nocardioidaceae bacterium]|nr:histidine phosphatase family protein [Nocardioidaceae bacterium]MCL2613754.1 histidine phosphatase family protein [Nocardioidaceae bacterium]
MRRLVLVRHGQTAWNAAGRIQGQLDALLDEVGRAQARAVAPVVAAMSPALIRSSDLSRARVTAETIASACGLPVSFDERLREYAMPPLEGLTHEEYAARDPHGFELFRAGEWDAIPEIEAPEVVAKRLTDALAEVVGALGADDLGVVVAHGACIRTGLIAWLGWPLELAKDLRPLTNCARVELAERENGRWAVASYNLAAPSASGHPRFHRARRVL